MVIQLVGEDLAHVAAAGWQRDATTRYVAGGLIELLAWWVDARSARTSDEIERQFHRLAQPVISALKESIG